MNPWFIVLLMLPVSFLIGWLFGGVLTVIINAGIARRNRAIRARVAHLNQAHRP